MLEVYCCKTNSLQASLYALFPEAPDQNSPIRRVKRRVDQHLNFLAGKINKFESTIDIGKRSIDATRQNCSARVYLYLILV